MRESIRKTKAGMYLDAAERVFERLGFQNTTMAEIGREAGCSKPTLYKYFDSKENLYMAITLRAFELLNANMRATVEKYQPSPGVECAIKLFWTYQEFSEQHFFYHHLLLEHLNFIRSVSNQKQHPWFTDAMEASPYFKQVKAVQNVPLMLSVSEIERGQKDGSIKNTRAPVEIYLTAWAFMIGFTKINLIASGTMYKYPLDNWKEHVYAQVEGYLRFGEINAPVRS